MDDEKMKSLMIDHVDGKLSGTVTTRFSVSTLHPALAGGGQYS